MASQSRSSRPVPRPGIMDIAAYVPGKSQVPGAVKVHKLSSNETPLGPSPRAVAAYGTIAHDLAAYPDGTSAALRGAIARKYGLNPERIICGAGSDELLSFLADTYLSPGDEGIYTEHGFLVYPIAIRAAGGVPVVAKERNCTVDVDAILAKVSERTKIVYLANPANPTGTYIPFEEVKRLHAGLPPHVLLVLDAAYAEYVRRNDYAAGIELVASAENVVMTRTFSKVYGLASLRIGWMFAPDSIVEAVNRIRGPFNVSGPAIAAGVAAIEDDEHTAKAVAHNAEWLTWLTGKLEALGLSVTPSVANFILIHFPDMPGRGAAEADACLIERGLILRRVSGYGFPNSLRLTIGSEEANRLVVEVLQEFMAGARPHA